MILCAARILVTFLSVVDWRMQQCLSAYTYEHPRVTFTEPDSISEHSDQVPAAQCVASYATSEFRLQSPGFPAPYSPQLQCFYIVEAVSKNICRLQANFLTFDLGECTSGDHVVIAGQTLCGNLGGARTFRFGSPRSLILFRTGSVSGGRGFDIAFTQVPCQEVPAPNRGCSREFSSPSVVLQNPGYPGSYPSRTHCQYIIRAATTGEPQQTLCQAQFTFESFNVDSSDGCTKDRLEVGDQEPLCGVLNGIRTYEFLGELHVDFYSEETENEGGFRIGVLQRHCRILNVPGRIELPPQPQPAVLPSQLLSSGLPPQRQPSVLLLQSHHSSGLPPQRQSPVLPPQPPLPILPPQPPPLTLKPTTHTSQFHLPLCCNKVYSGRVFFIVSPGFPLGNAHDDLDCIYQIQPYSPNVCRLRILFKLFWVGRADSYTGCSGGFLEIDGYQYCDCIIGFTVMSVFETVGNGRQKLLRYRQEGNAANSGGFLLEIFQEECTGGTPWSRHDVNAREDNKTGTATYHLAEQNGYNDPYTRSQAVDEETYFSKVRNKEVGTAYFDSNTADTSVTDRDQLHRDEQKYSHSKNSADELTVAVAGSDRSNKLQMNSDPSNRRDMAIQEKHGLGIIQKEDNNDTVQNEHGLKTVQKEHDVYAVHYHNYTINNSDKQIDELNSVHKCSSCADEKDVNTYFSGDTQSQDYDVFRSKTKAPFDGGKDKADSNTFYYNDNSAVSKSSASPVHSWDSNVTSFPNEMTADRVCESCRKDCTSAARDEQNCTVLTRNQPTADSGLSQSKSPEKRNVDFPEFQTDRFWSLRESACRVWGFAQWLLQVKRYFWALFPQLLCPIDSPSQSSNCQVLNQARGWIQSPGYPQSYPSNAKLCYRFQRLTGHCHIQLFMLDFSLEPSEDCVKDYLLLGGQWRYCGESLLSTGTVLDMSAAPHMDVLLVSDSQLSSRGFRAFYQHIPCNRRDDAPPGDCGQVTDREYFTLTRSGSTVQRSCVYRVLRHNTEVCGLRLNLTAFSLPCGAEYLQIDGRAYCGNLPGRSIEVDFLKPEVRIVYYRMDPHSKGHFKIDGKQLENCDFGLSEVPLAARLSNPSKQCDIQLSEVRGFVASPKTHVSSSQPEACAYVIHPHKGMCAVRMAFEAFNVPSTANCMSSFMEMHSQKFCNDELEHRTTVMDFDGRTLRVPFRAEGSPGTYYWNFTYTQIPCPLSGV